MLAKLWKKVLLAVCLVACLFNITYKLVNRHSLKENRNTYYLYQRCESGCQNTSEKFIIACKAPDALIQPETP